MTTDATENFEHPDIEEEDVLRDYALYRLNKK